MSILERKNGIQSALTHLIAELAPSAIEDAVRGGMKSGPDINLEKLALLNRSGTDFNILLNVFNELETTEDMDRVDNGVMATLFNVLRNEVHPMDKVEMMSRPLEGFPEKIIEMVSEDPISDSNNPIIKFADALRNKKTDMSELEAGSFIGEWKNVDVWGLVTLISLTMIKQNPGNILTLKEIAKRIETKKAEMNIHNPVATRLLMNIQTVMDSQKDYRHDYRNL